MKKLYFFVFSFLFFAIMGEGMVAAGQGGDEIRGLIRIFTPTPIERKVEVRVEDQGYDLKVKNKIDTFTFTMGNLNVYRAIVNGNEGALFLLYEKKEPLNVLIYEPEDMADFRSFLKKDRTERRQYIINDFKEYLKIEIDK